MKKLQQTFILITCIIVIAVAAAQRDGKIWGEQLSNNKKTTTTNQIDTLRTLDDGTIIINTTYLAKDVKGFGGTVPLNIYIKNGKIEKVEALKNSESPDFFQEASALLTRWNGKTTEQALAMKVDGVSGATFSSRGIIGNMKAGLVYASKKAQQPSIFEKMDLRAKSLIGPNGCYNPSIRKEETLSHFPTFIECCRSGTMGRNLYFMVSSCWIHVRRHQLLDIIRSNSYAHYSFHLPSFR